MMMNIGPLIFLQPCLLQPCFRDKHETTGEYSSCQYQDRADSSRLVLLHHTIFPLNNNLLLIPTKTPKTHPGLFFDTRLRGSLWYVG